MGNMEINLRVDRSKSRSQCHLSDVCLFSFLSPSLQLPSTAVSFADGVQSKQTLSGQFLASLILYLLVFPSAGLVRFNNWLCRIANPMFSYFCVVNILTIITFKLPYSVTECTVRKEMHTSSSYEPEGATPSSQASHPTVFSILLSPPSFSHLFLLSPICVTVQSLYFVSGQ